MVSYSIVNRYRIDIVDIYRWLGARCINNQMLSWVQAAGSGGRQASLSACDRRRLYRVAGRHTRGVRQCCTINLVGTHYQFLLTKSFHSFKIFWRFLPNKCLNKLKLEYCKAFTNRHWAVKFAKIRLISQINFVNKHPNPSNVFIASFIVSFLQHSQTSWMRHGLHVCAWWRV